MEVVPVAYKKLCQITHVHLFTMRVDINSELKMPWVNEHRLKTMPELASTLYAKFQIMYLLFVLHNVSTCSYYQELLFIQNNFYLVG